MNPGNETTQEQYKARASFRSALAFVIPIFILFLGVVPELVELTIRVAGEQEVKIPAQIYGYLTIAATVCTFVGTLINRGMLLPRVNELLTRLGAGPTPPADAPKSDI